MKTHIENSYKKITIFQSSRAHSVVTIVTDVNGKKENDFSMGVQKRKSAILLCTYPA